MKTVARRLYADYLMPSRLPLYDALLAQARDHGYRQTSVRGWLHTLRSARGRPPGPVLVHRHDIDSDLATARRMFEIEQRHGVRASYYFRLSTLDFGLMREIEDYGSEASYHYEELATYAKREHLKRPADVQAGLDRIRAEFEANFRRIEATLGRKLDTLASHGDFANRRLGMTNCLLLDDDALRTRCGIAAECYDSALQSSFDLYISDKPAPRYFQPIPPQAALGRHRRICLLTHPSQWHAGWAANSRKNLVRAAEALRW
ncbi:hypothetical protein ASF61_08530 [Duganella sp. Leaf126]|nr:hypothetical protein ASF61_08530 [Duganella sp. Leaf126]